MVEFLGTFQEEFPEKFLKVPGEIVRGIFVNIPGEIS